MIQSAFSLFLLHELPFERFDFYRWQSVLAITLIGALVGFDPSMRITTPGAPGLPVWVALITGVLSVWVGFLAVLGILKWWMKRGGRWNGRGDLFNLVAAAWLFADVLGAGLTVLGIPGPLTFPLWMYSIWVGATRSRVLSPRRTSATASAASCSA